MIAIRKPSRLKEEVLGFLFIEFGPSLITETMVCHRVTIGIVHCHPLVPWCTLQTTRISRFNDVESIIKSKSHDVVADISASAVLDDGKASSFTRITH